MWTAAASSSKMQSWIGDEECGMFVGMTIELTIHIFVDNDTRPVMSPASLMLKVPLRIYEKWFPTRTPQGAEQKSHPFVNQDQAK